MLFKLLFLLCIYEASSLRYESRLKKESFDLDNAAKIFDGFIKKFGKHYDTEDEYTRRFKIFKKNLEDVNNRNKNAATEVYGITQFLDKTDEEFNSVYTSIKWNPNLEDLYEAPDDLEPMINNYNDNYNEVPDSWDWRDQGVVTRVKDQGYCRSCWAFSAIGCVESQFAIKNNGTMKVLSEQQLVECYHEGGCESGDLAHIALNKAAQIGGLMTPKDFYSNKARNLGCGLGKVKDTVKVKGARVMKINDEEQLKKLVFEYGPVSIGIEITRGLDQYRGGISTEKGHGCTKDYKMNHGALLVGYGIENGVPYWIIKNSYGYSWGEQGFMRLIRGRKACSILQYVAIVDLL